ncbi:MAG TPA: flagellar motor protein MotB [Verrucomicrobiae bacterium]|jgi:chemotaxis protein MotB|nr:flagellar motor protein MotB [Verrucomicrobiae bacterium]
MARKKHGGHHGGSWKVAYADFVTAMMALFLCLWLTAQDTKIKDAVERAFRNPFSAVNKESTGIIPNPEKDATTPKTDSSGKFKTANAIEMEMLRHITEDLSKMLAEMEDAQNSVLLELTPDGLRINVFDRSQKPIFEAGSDVFTSYGSWVFSTLAWEISRYQTFRIELEGHTELNNETGRETHSKWELSADRANAARRKLLQNGVATQQIYKVSGFADTQPMAHTAPTAEVNRRVTVLLKVQNQNEPLISSASSTP